MTGIEIVMDPHAGAIVEDRRFPDYRGQLARGRVLGVDAAKRTATVHYEGDVFPSYLVDWRDLRVVQDASRAPVQGGRAPA